MSTFTLWVESATNGASHRQIAHSLGWQNTSLSRWMRDSNMPMERIVEMCRFYGARVFDGLKAGGYLTDRDLVRDDSGLPLGKWSTMELLDELRRREERRQRRKGHPPAPTK